jgi:hypothetical protein
MRFRPGLAAAATLGVALAALGVAIGQQLTPSGLSGNETWSVATGGPGGPSIFITSNHLRNTGAYVLTNTATGAYTSPANVGDNIFTAALSGGITLNGPTNPLDGQKVAVTNGTGAAFTQTVTFTPAAGQTVVNGAAANLAAGATAMWAFTATSSVWYRIQ